MKALEVSNGESRSVFDLPRLEPDEFRARLAAAPAAGRRISALFGYRSEDGIELVSVLARDMLATFEISSTRLTSTRLSSVTSDCPEAHLFEREIAESLGLELDGHPFPRPVRFPGAGEKVGVTDFHRTDGEEVHEVAVGPVHAGVIEPGHFRFQCHGERVFQLDISLGYQHRGVERALVGGPNKRTLHHMETLAGDTSVGHATAYSQLIEGLTGVTPPARALGLRLIGLELERLANHTGGLGALANDVGFLPTAAYCGRLRGEFLNLSAALCGNRFGRGLIRPAGVGFDLDPSSVSVLDERVMAAGRDVAGAVGLLWDTPSVQARFEDTGRVVQEVAKSLGLVGVAARASGLKRDVRLTHPFGMYRFVRVPIATWPTGDVFARAYVRWLEIQRSVQLVREQLAELPSGETRVELDTADIRPSSIAVSAVEGWRGEILHVALTDQSGRFSTYKIVDPSFHNWTGLSMALRGEQISDFPLCNKSFDLSYCGHDL
ncbi:MAG: NADH-quinone oxidoreductase subunit C [Deltaproteobacteria bacterium]|nr:NADH-quinone oxidoreductase subunit C [Deltaproteobacteria bacterium]